MNELGYQKLIIDVVRDAGGAAFKLSNRFLIGVPDLLVKLPRCEAALLEVKLNPFPKKSPTIRLAVTRPQELFLQKFRKAGMITGYVSILRDGTRFGIWVGSIIDVPVSNHEVVPVRERGPAIIGALEGYLWPTT